MRAARIATEAEAAGLTSPAAYARFAVCFHAAVRGELSGMTEARSDLARSVHGAEFAYLLELSYLMTGQAPPGDLPRAQWIDGADQTHSRWMDRVADRRQEITALREE